MRWREILRCSALEARRRDSADRAIILHRCRHVKVYATQMLVMLASLRAGVWISPLAPGPRAPIGRHARYPSLIVSFPRSFSSRSSPTSCPNIAASSPNGVMYFSTYAPTRSAAIAPNVSITAGVSDP